jgi:hypothetical protein
LDFREAITHYVAAVAALNGTNVTVTDSATVTLVNTNQIEPREVVVQSGHWMAQERPTDVNAALAKWLAAKLPALW